VELGSPPFSPPYSSFSDQDRSLIQQNFMKNQSESECSDYSISKPLLKSKLGDLLLSFDLNEKKNIFLNPSSFQKSRKPSELWKFNYLEKDKEISPVPLMNSPLSSLSDMMKIQKNLLTNDQKTLFKKINNPSSPPDDSF
jgi:hypothetical protein